MSKSSLIYNTFIRPATYADFSTVVGITYISDGSSLVYLSCTVYSDSSLFAYDPSINGRSCYYNTIANFPGITCSASMSGYQRFCPCSDGLSASPTSMKPTASPTTSIPTPTPVSKKWILGPLGASCNSACSAFQSGSVCSPDTTGSTFGW